MIKISVENLGPIVKGEVELKPLTIFIGPSNTGKSYMATAIYAVMKALESDPWRRRVALGGQYPRAARRRLGLHIRYPEAEEISGAIEAVRELIGDHGREGGGDGELTISVLPEVLRSELDRSILDWLGLLREDILGQIQQAFGDKSGFVNRRRNVEEFQMVVHRRDPLLRMVVHLLDGLSFMPEFDISRASVPVFRQGHARLEARSADEELTDLYSEFLYYLQSSAADSVLEGLPNQSVYMPAARSGIAQGHKVLTAALVRQSSRIGLEPVNIPTLPRITADFLSNLITLDPQMGPRRGEWGLSGPDKLYGERRLAGNDSV